VTGPRQSRYISFYTATFAWARVCRFCSQVARSDGFMALGLRPVGGRPLIAGCIIFLGCNPPPPCSGTARPGLLRSFSVLRNRTVLGYVLRYAVHCFELFGLRSWMVAFILFAYGLTRSVIRCLCHRGRGADQLPGNTVSILGNETAMRLGRTRYIPWR